MRLTYNREFLIKRIENQLRILGAELQKSHDLEAAEELAKAKYDTELRKFALGCLELHAEKGASLKIEIERETWQSPNHIITLKVKPAAGVPVRFSAGYKSARTFRCVETVAKDIEKAGGHLAMVSSANDKNVIITTIFDQNELAPYLQNKLAPYPK